MGTLEGHESARARGKTIDGAVVTDDAMLGMALHLRDEAARRDADDPLAHVRSGSWTMSRTVPCPAWSVDSLQIRLTSSASTVAALMISSCAEGVQSAAGGGEVLVLVRARARAGLAGPDAAGGVDITAHQIRGQQC